MPHKGAIVWPHPTDWTTGNGTVCMPMMTRKSAPHALMPAFQLRHIFVVDLRLFERRCQLVEVEPSKRLQLNSTKTEVMWRVQADTLTFHLRLRCPSSASWLTRWHPLANLVSTSTPTWACAQTYSKPCRGVWPNFVGCESCDIFTTWYQPYRQPHPDTGGCSPVATGDNQLQRTWPSCMPTIRSVYWMRLPW